MSERSITIFDGPATLILGLPLVTGHLTMSIVGRNSVAWDRVFTYDPASKIMTTDDEKLSSAVRSYGTGLGRVLSSLMFISDAITGTVKFVTALIRSFAGSFIGFGIEGIAIVLFLVLFAWMISLVALYYVAPLLIFSYALRYLKRKRLGEQEAKIGEAAMALFTEASSRVKAEPSLVSQS